MCERSPMIQRKWSSGLFLLDTWLSWVQTHLSWVKRHHSRPNVGQREVQMWAVFGPNFISPPIQKCERIFFLFGLFCIKRKQLNWCLEKTWTGLMSPLNSKKQTDTKKTTKNKEIKVWYLSELFQNLHGPQNLLRNHEGVNTPLHFLNVHQNPQTSS